MSRYSPYLRRLQRLEPEPEYIESWPPTEEGSLSKILYDQMIAEGVELPVERPGKDIAMYLLKLDALRVWADYVEPCSS
jgi:AAA+ ATPase superfamily predicted ATPase